MLGKRGSKETNRHAGSSEKAARQRNRGKQTGPLLSEAARGGAASSDRNQVLNYQNCLRAIGRYLDTQECRYMLVSETLEGFVVRAFPQGSANLQIAEAVVFTADDLATMVSQFRAGQARPVDAMKVPPLLPTGYEDFLRAVGFECDAAGMLDVRIVEMINGVVLTYSDHNNKERQLISYTARQIHDLLNKAFHRRGTANPTSVVAEGGQPVVKGGQPVVNGSPYSNGQYASPAPNNKGAVADVFATESLKPHRPSSVLKRIQR